MLDTAIINEMNTDELRNQVHKLQTYITQLRSSLVCEKRFNEMLIHLLTISEDIRHHDGVIYTKKAEIDNLEKELNKKWEKIEDVSRNE